jgi:branched-chain amino acid transport system permease protein
MQQVLLFVLLGLGSGALIACIALAVVLTYRGAGIINVASGAMAMLSGYAFWSLTSGQYGGVEFATAPALVLTFVITLIIGVLVHLVAFRPLRNAAPLAKLVSSLGVLLVAQASMVLAFGTTQKPQESVLPSDTVHVFGTTVPVDRFILAGIVVAMALGLAAAYRFTRFGLATRAASQDEVSALLAGLSASGLSLANTVLATLVAGTLGVLAASVTQLDAISLPLLVVPALAAALLARLTSFAIACAAGLGIGIVNSLIDYASTKSWFPTDHDVPLPGVKELIAFLLIVLAMFLRGAALPARGELVEKRLPAVPRPRAVAAPAIGLSLVCAAALVVLPFDFRQALINSLIGTIMALSLVVVTGFVGQISVVQLSLAGVAGFTVSHMAVDAGIGFPLAPLAGTAAAVILGELTAVSALRVRGVSLAVVTLGAAVAISEFGFVNSTWGGGDTGSPVPEPHLLGLDIGPHAAFRGLDGGLPSPVFGWVVLAVTVAMCLLVAAIRRGGIGMQMLAVRSNERAAAAAGTDVRAVKLIAFAISAFIAGVAGALYAYNFGSVSDARFDALTALSLIAFAYAGGVTLISGALFAGLVSTEALLPHAFDKWLGISGNWFLLFGGVILIFTLIQHPEGVAGALNKRLRQRRGPEHRARATPPLGAQRGAPSPAVGEGPPSTLSTGTQRPGGRTP